MRTKPREINERGEQGMDATANEAKGGSEAAEIPPFAYRGDFPAA